LPKQRTTYRGYCITVAPNGHGWRVWAYPLKTDLPILRRHSFTLPARSNAEALSEAKHQIDRLLRY
jgi:hypothetical protein